MPHIYIEDRIAKLEEAVGTLNARLADVLAANDKKRKADSFDKDELQAMLDKKADKEELSKLPALQSNVDALQSALYGQLKDVVKVDVLDQHVKELKEVKAAMAERGETAKKVHAIDASSLEGLQAEVTALRTSMITEERVAKAVGEVQQGQTKAINDMAQTVQDKVGQDLVELTKEQVNNIQSVLQTQAQQTQEQMKQISAHQGAQKWQDIDPTTDTTPFDVNRIYRIRIGEGQTARWLYSTEVSMAQLYTVDTILDQAIVVNSTSKGSYGARRLGGDITSTQYYAVFQMQSRAS